MVESTQRLEESHYSEGSDFVPVYEVSGDEADLVTQVSSCDRRNTIEPQKKREAVELPKEESEYDGRKAF